MNKTQAQGAINAAKESMLDGVPVVTLVDQRTGEVRHMAREKLFENRGVMLFFGIAILTLIAIWLGWWTYQLIIGEPDLTVMTTLEIFFIIASITAIALGYLGAFLVEYGNRKRRIAETKGEQLKFGVGGYAMVLGIIIVVSAITMAIVNMVFALTETSPYDNYYSWPNMGYVIFWINFGAVFLAAIGGFLLAKSIRGRDTVKERFQV